MDYTRTAVALALAMTALALAASAAPAEDLLPEEPGAEDAEGRFLGLLKKPLFFSGYDSVVETSLDNLGSVLGVPGAVANLLAGASRLRPFRPPPLRPLAPFLPFRPSRPYGYGYYPPSGYAGQYGYSPYAYDPSDYAYRDNQKVYDVEVVNE